jgi:hypothetical protein
MLVLQQSTYSLLILHRGSESGVAIDSPTDPVDLVVFSRGTSTDLLNSGRSISLYKGTWSVLRRQHGIAKLPNQWILGTIFQ